MVPAVAMFVGNVVCLCLSLVQSSTTGQKSRMKMMLVINGAVEVGAMWLAANRFGSWLSKSVFLSLWVLRYYIGIVYGALRNDRNKPSRCQSRAATAPVPLKSFLLSHSAPKDVDPVPQGSVSSTPYYALAAAQNRGLVHTTRVEGCSYYGC